MADAYGARQNAKPLRERAGADERGRRAIADWAAHRKRQRPDDRAGGEHFLDGKAPPVLRTLVVDGMLMVFGADGRHLPLRRAERRHVVSAKSCVDVHKHAVRLV